MKRVAVVGGGIFGTTAAIYAARAGHEVHLFEELGDILQAASGINQYRFHRGYHYPRSSDTARSALESEHAFREEYAEAVVEDSRHLYAIAKEGSRVSGKEFLAFCETHNLPYTVVEVPNLVNHDNVELVIEGKEARLDIHMLRGLVKQKLKESGVVLHLNARAGRELSDKYDFIVVATYAKTGPVFSEFTDTQPEHQYEICEKPVVELPPAFGQTSLVVLDGPFMCVDPLGRTNRYVLGNVVHAIHASNTGFEPDIPPSFVPLLNRGIVEKPSITNFDAFIETGIPFIPMLRQAKHVGSMYTVRTVLPRLEEPDARPTLVTISNEKYIKIFSGKIGNSVEAAKETCALIEAAQ